MSGARLNALVMLRFRGPFWLSLYRLSGRTTVGYDFCVAQSFGCSTQRCQEAGMPLIFHHPSSQGKQHPQQEE